MNLHVSDAFAHPVDFAEKAIFINTPKQTNIPFVADKRRKRLLDAFYDHPRLCAITARQIGSTTCGLIYALWYALSGKGRLVALSSSAYRLTQSNMNHLLNMIEKMPENMKPRIIQKSRNQFIFNNDSRILFLNPTENMTCGLHISLLILDNFALVRKAETVWQSLRPLISQGGRCIITTVSPSGHHIVQDIYKSPGFVGMRFPREDQSLVKPMIGDTAYAREFEAFFVENDGRIIDPDSGQEVPHAS